MDTAVEVVPIVIASCYLFQNNLEKVPLGSIYVALFYIMSAIRTSQAKITDTRVHVIFFYHHVIDIFRN